MYFYRLLTLLLLLMTSSMYISSQTPCGFLNQVTGSPFITGGGAGSVAYSPLIGTNTFYAAVANHDDFTVSVYSVNASTGVFTQVGGSPFATGIAPESVAFSPLIGTNILYAAVANDFDNTVSVYSVNTNTGVFTQVTDSPFAAGGRPESVAFSPLIGTNILYAAVANNGGASVSVYSVNTSTGVFTPVSGSPFAAGGGPISVAFSPLIGTNTLYAAVANNNDDTVFVYSVNTNTGAFTQVSGSPFATGAFPESVAFSPLIGANKLYAAIANLGDTTVSLYSVDTSTGVFTQIGGSATGNGPLSVTYSPLIGTNTLYAAVANNLDKTVSVYNVNTNTGAFKQVAGSPFAIVSNPFSVAFSPLIGTNTLYAAVTNDSRNVSVFRVDLGPAAQLQASPSTITLGESSELTLSIVGEGPFTVQWSDGVAQSGESPIIRTVKPTETATFAAVVTDINGCTAESNAATVTVESPIPPPTILSASLQADPNCLCPGGGMSLLRLKIVGGLPPFTIKWPDGKVRRTKKRTVVHKFFTARDRKVRVRVTDNNGLSALSNFVTIKIFPHCGKLVTKKNRAIRPRKH